MKKIILFAFVLVLALSMTACNKTETTGSSVGSSSASSAGSSSGTMLDNVKSFLKGDVTGETGKVYSTQWFDFEIKSIQAAKEFGDFEAEDGYQFVDVLVYEKNTFAESIPMGSVDFYLDAESFEEYEWAIEPLDETVMPEEFELKPGESCEYHVLFVIPEDVKNVDFVYVEIDENDTIGATFTIKCQL